MEVFGIPILKKRLIMEVSVSSSATLGLELNN